VKRQLAGAATLFSLALAAPDMGVVCHSAPPPSSSVTVHADFTDPAPPAGTICYSADSQGSWTQVPMTRMAEPGYDSTWAGTFPVGGSGALRYYVRAEAGPAISTQSPCNTGNTWPVTDNFLALAARDTTGDARNPEGPFLDLTGAYVGWSADRFYALLTNNSSSWPLNGGILGPWYLYSVGFVNPEAPSDTWVFSLSYADIPLAFSTGLYLINRYTADYTRLADIEVNTSGNRLALRCLASDMTGHEKFGPWPNTSGFLSVAANTQTIRISGATAHDTTVACRYYVRTPGFTVGQNRAPSLYQGRVVPQSGTPETDFWFNVRYADEDSNLPPARSLVVDSDTFTLKPNQHRYWMGALFDATRSGFGIGWHRFHFTFSDGMSRVETAADSFLITGTGLAEPGAPASARTAPSARPNPFTTVTSLQLAADSPSRVRIYDAAGRSVRVLAASCVLSAVGLVAWDGRDDAGRPVPPGIYFCSAGSGPRLALVKTGR
jgi:hypothetical protein